MKRGTRAREVSTPPFAERREGLPDRLDAALRTGALLTRFRDRETAEHVRRVGRAARVLAEALAPRWCLSDERVEAVAVFAMAHDIGKLAVPEGLLGKNGPLDERESARMKSHTVAGASMVEGMADELGLAHDANLALLSGIVRSHHELMDGSGYPDGLAGDAIPCEARLVAVADVYDALRSRRSYKGPWAQDEVLDYLRAESRAHLDAEAVLAAIGNARELEAAWSGESAYGR